MLTSKQRAQLKALAAELSPIFQIGKGGINDNMCVQLDDTLEARELIKISILETSPVTAREASEILSARLGADVVIVIGKKFVLYRQSKENKQIELVKMTKIGIYGGTFAPVHLGHVGAALSFLEKERLDKLYVIPAGIPPHKDITWEDDSSDRYKMLELAFCNNAEYGKRLFLSDYEISRSEKSYTVNTLHHFLADDISISLLCGTDMFLSLSTWYKAEEIFKIADIVCVRREKDKETGINIEKKIAEYEREYGARVRLLELEPFEISSKEIRGLVARGEKIDGFVPAGVASYIKEKGLYRNIG